MAYKKTYKRNYRRKRTGYKNRGMGGVAATARAALKIAKQVKDVVGMEYKEKNNVVTTNLNDGNGTAFSSQWRMLTDVSQGDSNGERIGDSLKLQRISGRGTIALGTAQTTAIVRIILVRGKNELGQIYRTVSSSTLGVAGTDIMARVGPLSPKYEPNKYSTKFIYDKTFVLDNASHSIYRFNWNIPLNWHQTFMTATNNDIRDGGLYLLAIANSTGAASANTPLFFLDWTISYTD